MQPSVCLHIVHRCQKIEHLYDKLNYMLNVPEKSSSDNSFFLILNWRKRHFIVKYPPPLLVQVTASWKIFKENETLANFPNTYCNVSNIWEGLSFQEDLRYMYNTPSKWNSKRCLPTYIIMWTCQFSYLFQKAYSISFYKY